VAKISKILLVNPVYKRPGYFAGLHRAFQPLALGVLAALTPAEIEIVLIDEKFDNFDEKIEEISNVDMVGITGFTSNISRGYKIAHKARQKGIPVVMGGIHVSFNHEEALNYCDSVVIGEAEGLWEQVLKDLEQGKLNKIYRHNINVENIKQSAVRRDIFQKYKYSLGGIQTARGCPMNCDFCSVTAFNGFKYRKRDIDDIISEFKGIQQKEIFICDDNIIGRTEEQKAHSLKLFKRMVEEKMNKRWVCQASLNVGEDSELLDWMYKSGCRIMLVGFESPSKKNLKSMNKAYNLSVAEKYGELINRIHRSGIAVLGAFILGYPDDGPHSADEVADFIKEYKIDAFIISHLTPLPGTKLYKRIQAENRFLPFSFPEDWNKFEFVNVVFNHEKLSKQQLEEIMKRLRGRVTVPISTVLLRFLNTLKETKSISTAILSLKYNLLYRQTYLRRIRQADL
jgi:radical SAM superfamily enzyme YgiQ (UPF0313 family)